MSLNLSTLSEKIKAIERIIVLARESRNARTQEEVAHYEALKAIASDLRARERLPRNNALGELERALTRMKGAKTALGYEDGKMVAVANVVINKWPVIRQALENFGEESAE